jgi:hypothetical protein
MLEADARAVQQVALLVVVAPAALLRKPLARPVYGAAAERAGREPGLRGGSRPERLAGPFSRPIGTRSRYEQQGAQHIHYNKLELDDATPAGATTSGTTIFLKNSGS